MEYAKNAALKVVSASNAEYGIYHCTECNRLAYLRRTEEITPHFYHFRYNSACTLCNIKEYGEASYKLTESQQVCDTLRKNATLKNWFDAINCLLRNNHLYLLQNCEWAIRPISLYINNHMETISHETIYKLISLFLESDNDKFSKILLNSIMNPLITVNDRIRIIDDYFRKKKQIDDALLTGILTENTSPFILLYLFRYLTENQRKTVQEYEKYRYVWLLQVVTNIENPDLRCICEYDYFKKYKQKKLF